MLARKLTVAVVGTVVASGVGIAVVKARASTAPPCRVTADGQVYALQRDQVRNALIITEAAQSARLPHHAVTIAVAAALEETGLHNLSHGDRDSLGLFQQRPSQGWGTPSQIMNPSFAANAFFRALARITDWQSMSVNDAAQAVQRSATPTAYASAEAEARAIARATTGELSPGALRCAS
jgi:hypothetical protein